MAVWQFPVDFVPEDFLVDAYGYIPVMMSVEARRAGGYFRQAALTVDKLRPYLRQLGTFDPDSWDNSAYYHGQADNDATVWVEEATGYVSAISCRLDMRQFDEAFSYGLLSLAAAFRCQLMTRRGELFEPTAPALLQTMEQSSAARFVADPLKFLDDLSKNDPAARAG